MKRFFTCLALTYIFMLSSISASVDPYIILTHPKGGTGLLSKTLDMIHEPRKISLFSIPDRKNFHPEMLEECWEKGGRPGTHLHAPRFTRDYFYTHHSDFKLIVIIRDIRDAYVSFAHWIHRENEPDLPEREKIYRAFERKAYFEMSSHLSLFIDDPRFYVVRFEDLVGPMGGGSQERQIQTIHDLAAFISRPISMSQAEEYGKQLFGGTGTFRNGQIGSWKKACNEEQKQWFKDYFADELIRLGYEKDYDW